MLIERAELREVQLALKSPFRTARGRTASRRLILVHLQADGVEGWGECAAGVMPGYTAETVEEAWSVLTGLLMDLIGQPAPDPSAGPAASDTPMAAAALEAALWDLTTRRDGQPLWAAWGGTGEQVPVTAVLGVADSISKLLTEAELRIDEGYRTLKLKIHPKWGLRPVEAIRSRFPDLALAADANGSYATRDTAQLLEIASVGGLFYLEQPFPPEQLEETAQLGSILPIPICLDEAIPNADVAQRALSSGAAGMVNLKAGRVGGAAEAMRIAELAVHLRVPALIGGLLETGIGRAHSLALATLPGITVPSDLSASNRYWDRDLTAPWILTDGGIRPTDKPGLGVPIDTEFIDRCATRSWAFPP